MKWMRAARNANAMNIKYGRYADRNRAEKKKEKIALCDQTHVDMKWASRFYVKAFLVETCKRRQLWNIFQHFFLPFLSTSISIVCVYFCLLHSSAASKCHTNTRAERKKSEAIHFALKYISICNTRWFRVHSSVCTTTLLNKSCMANEFRRLYSPANATHILCTTHIACNDAHIHIEIDAKKNVW